MDIITPTIYRLELNEPVDFQPVFLLAKIAGKIPKDATTVPILTPTGEQTDIKIPKEGIMISILTPIEQLDERYIKEIPLTRSTNNRPYFTCPVCKSIEEEKIRYGESEKPLKGVGVLYYPLTLSMVSDTWMCRHCVCKRVPIFFGGYGVGEITPRMLYKSLKYNGESFKNIANQIDMQLSQNNYPLTPRQKKNLFNRKHIGEKANIGFIKILSAHEICNTALGRKLINYWIIRGLIINGCLVYDKHVNWAAQQDQKTFWRVISLFIHKKLDTAQKEQLMHPIYNRTDNDETQLSIAEPPPPELAEQAATISEQLKGLPMELWDTYMMFQEYSGSEGGGDPNNL